MADVEDHERAQIIALLEQGLPSAEVARRLGTRTIRVAAIKAHMTMGSYADLSADRPGVSADVHGSGVRATLDDSQRAEIRALLADGLSTAEIARQLGVRPMRVAAIKAHVTMGTYGEISPSSTPPIAGDENATAGMGEAMAQAAQTPSERSAASSDARTGALQLDDEARSQTTELHRSDSAIQRAAESVILAKVSEHFAAAITPKVLTLPSGARVEVDGAAPDLPVFVEVFARQGTLKGGQQKKVCQDALKLITIGRTHPNAQLVIAFADEDAAADASRGTWVAEALATWAVQVLIVDLIPSVAIPHPASSTSRPSQSPNRAFCGIAGSSE
jgi:anti-sigma28 factor (negative regulator of flagellin synthesis)